MKTLRLNIEGPKGNAFYILSTVTTLGRQLGLDAEEIKLIKAQMTGDVIKKLGGESNDYEGLLRAYLDNFPFVELYSTSALGIDPSLYTLEDESRIFEL